MCEACEEVNRIEARGRKYDPFMKVNALPICSLHWLRILNLILMEIT